MKNRLKTLALTAALFAAAVPAVAQTATTNVTLYGLLDVYVQHGKGTATGWALQSGGQSGSRLGVRGSEDLGGGLSAVFTLENGIAADTGTVTQGGVFWGRQAFLGLSSKEWGALTAGRQYSPHFFASVANDIFGTGVGGGFASFVTTTVFRVDNSVTYELPKIAGVLGGSVMQSAGEGGAAGTKATSAHLRYASGPAGLSLAYLQRNTVEKQKLLSLAGSYDFKVVKLVAGWQDVKNLTGALGAADDRREVWLQAAIPVSASGTVQLGAAQAKASGATGKDAKQWTAGYSHALSKRTNLYAIYTQVDNGTATNYTTGGATGAGPAVTAGVDATALTFGVRHSF
ncbi:porin [Roseateles asaccharophilus]|uniref:Porin n=1 Tax=Roseateles asaccharophilus TaxID=582607 RepID=A0ABU2A8W3_9BURK|nr:porin [Roseateles asaccharophilus]MDR7333645.1 putative porin [Roseateles asaccharophilus]